MPTRSSVPGGAATSGRGVGGRAPSTSATSATPADTCGAPDAVIVDSTELSADEVIERIVELARERGA